ncbi:transposase, partial [Rhodobacteraceae bacterium]|nr:transposase [Paracoccaceae bacterium]
PRIPGATVFFTVGLADRNSSVLVDHIGCLREAVRKTQVERPFYIDAFVVLPNHLHTVWTLPEGDSDCSTRWGAIKARFTRACRAALTDPCRPGFSPAPYPKEFPIVQSGRYAGLKPGLRQNKREQAVWQRRFWEHYIRGSEDFVAAVSYCHINPVKHGFVDRAEDWPYSSVHREIRAGRWAA